MNFNQKRTIKTKPNNAITAIDNCFKNFKAHNSEIYIFDNYINKVDYNGNIISKKKFNYLIKGFVLGKDLNLYIVSENNLYIVKQYSSN